MLRLAILYSCIGLFVWGCNRLLEHEIEHMPAQFFIDPSKFDDAIAYLRQTETKVMNPPGYYEICYKIEGE